MPCVHGNQTDQNRGCICHLGYGGYSCDVKCPLSADNGLVCGGPVRGRCSEGVNGTGKCECSGAYRGTTCNCTDASCAARDANSVCGPAGQCGCDKYHKEDTATGRCTLCADGHWGISCRELCSCVYEYSAEVFSNHSTATATEALSFPSGLCNRVSGNCECFTDPERGYFQGSHCEKCAGRYTGFRCQIPSVVNTAVSPLTGVLRAGSGGAPNSTRLVDQQTYRSNQVLVNAETSTVLSFGEVVSIFNLSAPASSGPMSTESGEVYSLVGQQIIAALVLPFGCQSAKRVHHAWIEPGTNSATRRVIIVVACRASKKNSTSPGCEDTALRIQLFAVPMYPFSFSNTSSWLDAGYFCTPKSNMSQPLLNMSRITVVKVTRTPSWSRINVVTKTVAPNLPPQYSLHAATFSQTVRRGVIDSTITPTGPAVGLTEFTAVTGMTYVASTDELLVYGSGITRAGMPQCRGVALPRNYIGQQPPNVSLSTWSSLWVPLTEVAQLTSLVGDVDTIGSPSFGGPPILLPMTTAQCRVIYQVGEVSGVGLVVAASSTLGSTVFAVRINSGTWVRGQQPQVLFTRAPVSHVPSALLVDSASRVALFTFCPVAIVNEDAYTSSQMGCTLTKVTVSATAAPSISGSQSLGLKREIVAALATSANGLLMYLLVQEFAGALIRRYLRWEATSVVPNLASVTGSTVVTVIGNGFANTGNVQCRFTPLFILPGVTTTYSPAIFINGTAVSCRVPVTEVRTACNEFDQVDISLNGRTTFTENAVRLRRVESPILTATSPSRAQVPSAGALLSPITVFGSGFVSSEYCRCAFARSLSNVASTGYVTRGVVLSSKEVLCDPPKTQGRPLPPGTSIFIGLDGQHFVGGDSMGTLYVLVGRAVGARFSQFTYTASCAPTTLIQFELVLIDAEGNAVGSYDDSVLPVLFDGPYVNKTTLISNTSSSLSNGTNVSLGVDGLPVDLYNSAPVARYNASLQFEVVRSTEPSWRFSGSSAQLLTYGRVIFNDLSLTAPVATLREEEFFLPTNQLWNQSARAAAAATAAGYLSLFESVVVRRDSFIVEAIVGTGLSTFIARAKVQIVPGVPAALSLQTTPGNSSVQVVGPDGVLPYPPTVGVVDAGGNRVPSSEPLLRDVAVLAFITSNVSVSNSSIMVDPAEVKENTNRTLMFNGNDIVVFDRFIVYARSGFEYRVFFAAVDVRPTSPDVNVTSSPTSGGVAEVGAFGIRSAFSQPIVAGCPAGMFIIRGEYQCRDCAPHAVCDGLRMSSEPGYWLGGAASTVLYKCISDGVCPGGPPGTCGDAYEGPRCEQCREGYAKGVTHAFRKVSTTCS